MIRVFLKPAGEKFIDFPLADGVNIGHVVNVLKFEGGLWSEHAYVPSSEVHYLVAVNAPDIAKPNLLPFPGSKEGA